MLRLAPERIAKLALLDTSARSDTVEQSAAREKLIAMAQAGRLDEVVDALAPRFLRRNREHDPAFRRLLRDMASETGADAFVRQQKAIVSPPDARPLLASIRCPTMVLVGDGDRLTPPDLSQEICAGIPECATCRDPGLRPPVDGRTADGGQCRTCGMAWALITRQLCKAFRPSSLCHSGDERLYVGSHCHGQNNAHAGRNRRSGSCRADACAAPSFAGH